MNSYDGLYYSHVTGCIFEAIRKGNFVYVKYSEGFKPKKIPFGSFVLQNELYLYDQIIDYGNL